MSKYVKNLIADDLRGRLEGVDDALLVDVIGIDANATVRLRADLRSKGIKLMVIKNSLAKRATEGSALAPALDGVKGTLALLLCPCSGLGGAQCEMASSGIRQHRWHSSPITC